MAAMLKLVVCSSNAPRASFARKRATRKLKPMSAVNRRRNIRGLCRDNDAASAADKSRCDSSRTTTCRRSNIRFASCSDNLSKSVEGKKEVLYTKLRRENSVPTRNADKIFFCWAENITKHGRNARAENFRKKARTRFFQTDHSEAAGWPLNRVST